MSAFHVTSCRNRREKTLSKSLSPTRSLKKMEPRLSKDQSHNQDLKEIFIPSSTSTHQPHTGLTAFAILSFSAFALTVIKVMGLHVGLSHNSRCLTKSTQHLVIPDDGKQEGTGIKILKEFKILPEEYYC